MKRKILITFCLIAVGFLFELKAQAYYYYPKSYYYYNRYYGYYSYETYDYTPYYFSQTLGFVSGIYNDYMRDKQKKEEEAKAAEQMKQRITQMKDYYASIGKYAETVRDGWHEVTIIGGGEFIDTRKVYVQNNRVTKMYADEWIENPIASAGPIVNCRTGVQLKGKDASQVLLDVYFINYLGDQSVLAEPPLTPGKVVFSAINKAYGEYYIQFQDALFGPFKNKFKYNYLVGCNEESAMNISCKPGRYKIKAVVKRGGADNGYQSVFEIDVKVGEGECRTIQLNEFGLKNTTPFLKSADEYKKGKVAFCTNIKKYNMLYVEIDGNVVGPFVKKYSKKMTSAQLLECAVKIEYKPGTYTYRILKDKGYSYTTATELYQEIKSGEITIKEGDYEIVPILK
ncbi:MAG: hypothetical protein J0M08_02690 [Bacteroidetes bacterium]|nr:hypothetical protein [Bacteroidota bacterium]